MPGWPVCNSSNQSSYNREGLITRGPHRRQSCSTDNLSRRLKKGCSRRSSTCCAHPCLTNSNALDSTGSTRVAYLISLCVMANEWTRRSSTLYIASSSLNMEGKGSRDNASATVFRFYGTNLMLLLNAFWGWALIKFSPFSVSKKFIL